MKHQNIGMIMNDLFFQPKQDKNLLDNLLSVVTRLKTIEAQMQRMRNECQEREKIWEAVEREVKDLEEKAVIYRYRVMDTQSLHDEDKR
ncbi:hypothetical protein GCK32_014320 [Trichostrongylus colubriformis]|uniref:Uncharacterized protein n=1 Tax=Trichostrongylus colubriformis TaxID=6319 RepID=A0AAN8IKB1_TRICO